MITQKRGQPIYLLNKNLEVRLWYYHFAYASNTWIIQGSKLVNKIRLLEIAISNFNNDSFCLVLKTDTKEWSELDIDTYITLALLNKIIKSIEDLYNICIKSRYIRIIKYKVMTPIIWKLKEIHTNI